MAAIGSTFRSGEPSLNDILQNIDQGNIQLPDFQRGWVWDDDHIRALIASVSLSYPIGAVMILETGGEGVKFKPRNVEGVTVNNTAPNHLILDGQQRMTSLYLSLKSGRPVPTRTDKGKDIQRVYYLNMVNSLNPEIDRFDAVVSLPPDRIVRSDFGRQIDLDVSSREKEYENLLFPLEMLFNHTGFAEWKWKFQEHFNYAAEKIMLLNKFEQDIWLKFQQYRVPTIELLKDTPKEAVCQVFEKVNTGGVSLTVFELVTATFAADDFQLRQNWEDRQTRLHKHDILKSVDATTFLTALTLLSTYQKSKTDGKPVSCKRNDILKLTLEEYKKYENAIEQGMVDATRFLTREKVYDVRSMPYQTQIIPLAVICAVLGNKFEEDAVKQKIGRWYWCGVFGELYGGANETRFAIDVQDVVTWIGGGDIPKTISDASFSPTRLLTLQSRLSAAYKGVMARLIHEGSHDFINGDSIDLTTYFGQAVDIHHIFPAHYCETQKYDRLKWNSVVNKAPLTYRTNRILSGSAPSKYISSIEKNHKVDTARLDEILATHLINPNHLREDKFEDFINHRATKLLDMIEKAMGKTVSGRDSEEVVAAFGAPLINQASTPINTLLNSNAISSSYAGVN